MWTLMHSTVSVVLARFSAPPSPKPVQILNDIPDFLGSKTCKVLKQYGVENGLVNAYNRSKVYAHQLER